MRSRRSNFRSLKANGSRVLAVLCGVLTVSNMLCIESSLELASTFNNEVSDVKAVCCNSDRILIAIFMF